jgi:hypothetical protein
VTDFGLHAYLRDVKNNASPEPEEAASKIGWMVAGNKERSE